MTNPISTAPMLLPTISAVTWLIIGFVTYLATAAIGTTAQLRLINTNPFRWVHHIGFAGIWFTLGAIVISGWRAPWLVFIGVVIACMAAMPRLKAGTRPHCNTALLGIGAYIGALVWAIAFTL